MTRGYTSGGLGLNMNVARGEIRVDEEFGPKALTDEERAALAVVIADATERRDYYHEASLAALDGYAHARKGERRSSKQHCEDMFRLEGTWNDVVSALSEVLREGTKIWP